MSLIPAQYVEPRDTLSLRLDHTVHERLQQYAAFIQSPKDYVIGQALERIFRSDKKFTKWLAAQPPAAPTVEADGGAGTDEDAPAPRRRTVAPRGGPSRVPEERSKS
jgi:predicted transcriptional regulator